MKAQEKKSPSQEEYEALLLAASKTAGSESWKTCAGRKSGPDHFLPTDAWRCFKISLQKHVKKKRDSSVCPVCLDVPSNDDADDGWYQTKSCNHSVCKECLRQYSQNLLSDPSHSGPLKCPCCPRLLREDDALVALSLARNNVSSKTMKGKKKKSVPSKDAVELLEKWNNKAINEMLRKMDDYRPCPNCDTNKHTDDTTTMNSEETDIPQNAGGGFVSTGCLASISEERQSNAQFFVRLAESGSAKMVILGYTFYYLHRCSSAAQDSELRQIAVAILPALCLPIFLAYLNVALVSLARKQMMRPIPVICPCCEMEFNLPSSEIDIVKKSTESDESEMATQQWKFLHTRNCPTCSTPIQKNGGCNHVRCARCNSEFCWACMRARTRCRAYNCENGAPYGGGMTPVEHFTLIERIDRLEFNAREQLRLFPRPELLIPIFCSLFHFVGLDSWAGKTAWWLLCRLARATFSLSRAICVAALCWASSNHCRNWLRRRQAGTFRNESEMIAEVLSRSMREY